jgi:flagellar biosynthesis protein FlhF
MLPSGYINKLFWIQQQMRIGGVDRDIARELMAGLHHEAARQARITEASLLEMLKQGIADRIRRKPASALQGDRPKTVVFIGPTGVGKTTTIAKIAALYNHNRPSSVGLVTLDDQRIGGMSQLASYARIIGIPARAAASPAALHKALEKLAHKRLILVDTGGVNPYDREQIHRLDTTLAVIHKPRVHLVLSTLTKSNDVNTMVEAFKRLPVQDLLFTKVDESTSQGNILSQSLRSGLPLSYYTDGRHIPDDIHVLTAESLVRMIFNPASLRRAKTAAPEILAKRLQAFEEELENIPMAYSPYRTYSTGLGDIPGAYAAMAASNG